MHRQNRVDAARLSEDLARAGRHAEEILRALGGRALRLSEHLRRVGREMEREDVLASGRRARSIFQELALARERWSLVNEGRQCAGEEAASCIAALESLCTLRKTG